MAKFGVSLGLVVSFWTLKSELDVLMLCGTVPCLWSVLTCLV